MYKSGGPEFDEGYRLVQEKFSEVKFYNEYDFCGQINSLVSTSPHNAVGFFTDDCVMFRKPTITPREVNELLSLNIFCFSLRLGVNTVIQDYLTGSLQPKLNFSTLPWKAICWRWKNYSVGCNYGYMFSWDGHFYKKDSLQKYLQGKTFEGPRALEHQVNTDYRLRQEQSGVISACMESSVFVNTVNCVQENGPAAGTKYSYSVEDLNAKLLGGEVISLASFSSLDIRSSHEEFPLSWEDSDSVSY